MSQPREIMALRKRMKNRGYTDISFKRDKLRGLYTVTAREPVTACIVTARLDLCMIMTRCR